jgi:hypothetical protein
MKSLPDVDEGELVYLPERGAICERVGTAWVQHSIPLRPGVTRAQNYLHEDVEVDVPRCESRRRENGRIVCRCNKPEGHDRTQRPSPHANAASGRSWRRADGTA